MTLAYTHPARSHELQIQPCPSKTIQVPLVSVIIPTYNHSAYLATAVHSVFAQSLADFELIVVNDGSVDDTAKVIDGLKRLYNITSIEQDNAGQAAARNTGLAHARGEFIALLDDDDYWPTDKLAWQTEHLVNHRAILVGGTVALFRRGKPPHLHLGTREAVLDLEALSQGCPFVSPGQVLMRRTDLVRVGGFDSRLRGLDDYDLYLRLAEVGPLSFANRVSLYYRIHELNASRRRAEMLGQTRLVVNMHFPPERGSLHRKANRSLYFSAGREWVLAARRAVGQWQFITAFLALWQVAFLLREAVRDPRLVLQIFRDLLPEFILPKKDLSDWHLMIEVSPEDQNDCGAADCDEPDVEANESSG